MKKYKYVTKTPMNLRTRINDLSPVGGELSDEDLRLAAGGLPDECTASCYVSTAPPGIIG